MPLGHFRTGLVATFAVMFGIVQLLCACMNVPSAAAASPDAHTSNQMSMGCHDPHAMMDMEEQGTPSHDHGEHDHQADCSHCDDTVVLAVTTDFAPNIFTTPSTFKTAYFEPAPATRAGMAASNLAALRWLDPPRRLSSPDPVTLHTRSLI